MMTNSANLQGLVTSNCGGGASFIVHLWLIVDESDRKTGETIAMFNQVHESKAK